jgi:hypothetical protein
MSVRLAIAMVIAGLLTACASWTTAPSQLEAPQWSIDIPKGWMRFSTPDYDMLSKDGPYLQYILIQARPVEQPFRFTHRKLASGMLPHEAAQVVMDSLYSDPKIRQFSLIRNQPVTLDRFMGFRLEYSYIDTQGVDIRSVYYGAITGRFFVNLRYSAAKRHYFAKDMTEFEQIRQSLRLDAGP